MDYPILQVLIGIFVCEFIRLCFLIRSYIREKKNEKK